MDFNELMKGAQDTINNIGSAADAAAEVTSQGAEIANARATQARETASAAERIERIKLEDKARQENTRKSVAGAIGTDPNQVGWRIGALADKVNQADEVLDSERENIRQIDSVGFLDNPIAFIAGQLQRKSHVANYNAAADQKDAAVDSAAALQKLTSDQFQNINALTQTVSEAYIQAATLVESNQFQAQASDAALQAVRMNLEGIRIAADRSKDQLAIMFQANNAQMAQKQMSISLEHLKMARDEFDLKKKAFEEKTSEDSLILKYVQNGYFAHTGKQMDAARAKEVTALYKAKNPDVMNWFTAGVESSMVGRPMISSSPFDVTTLYATSRLQNLPAAQKQVADQLVGWRRDWEKTPEGQAAIAGKDKSAAERSFNTYIGSKVADGSSELYKPMPLKQVAANNKFVGLSAVWKNVLEPAATAGVNVDDPNTAFGLITSAIQGGKLSYPDALDYSTAIASGLDLNNQAKNFLSFGMQPARSYNAGISMPESFGKTKINLADQREFATKLNIAMARIASKDAHTLTDSTWSGVANAMPRFGSQLQYEPQSEHERLLAIRKGGKQ